VVTFQLSGQALLDIVLRNLAADADEKRGFLSTSGLTWTWRTIAAAPEIVAVRVNGAPLDLAKDYTVAASSYLTEQWQKHLGAEPRKVEAAGYNDFDAAVEFARSRPVVDPGDLRGVEVK
jgi:hypothetical protein